MTNTVKVGIGVLLHRNEGTEVLMGKRKGSHGEGEWSFPGGHLEYLETFFGCAVRELAEEIGSHVRFKNLDIFTVLNLTDYAPKHYIDIGICAEWVSGDPIVMEPDKCEEWKWFNITDLPSPRFATIDRIIAAYTGVGPVFIDSDDDC